MKVRETKDEGVFFPERRKKKGGKAVVTSFPVPASLSALLPEYISPSCPAAELSSPAQTRG